MNKRNARLRIFPSFALALLALLLLAGCNREFKVGALQSESQAVELGDAKSVRVAINMGAGDLKVKGGAEKLMEADFAYNVARLKPEVSYKNGTLVVRQPERSGLPNLGGVNDFRNDWRLRFNDQVPMDLSVDMGAGTGDLELAGLGLTGLDINLGAGEYDIDLGGNWSRDLDATIDAGAADVKLRLPKDIGVRVKIESGPHTIQAQGLTNDGGTYTNAAYGSSDVALDIDLSVGVGRITLEEEGEAADAASQGQQASQLVTTDAQRAEAGAALQGLLDDQVRKQGIPGMAMAVRLADGTVVSRVSGYLDPAKKRPWTTDAVSMLASVTKTYTAVVIMQLVKEGKLSLDDTIDKWFPNQPNGDKITVRMLLSHTSGLSEYMTEESRNDPRWTSQFPPTEAVAEANRLGPASEPGGRTAHYTNTNYFVLGLIIEAVTGKSWEEAVRSHIIEPLGLKRTAFVSDEGLWGKTLIEGYFKTPKGYVSILDIPNRPSASTAWANGGVVSSLEDLTTFASALFDGKLVPKATLAEMATGIADDPDGVRGWGLGGATLKTLPGSFGMGGDAEAYHSFYAGIQGTKYIVAALVNTSDGDPIGPSLMALEYLLSQPPGD